MSLVFSFDKELGRAISDCRFSILLPNSTKERLDSSYVKQFPQRLIALNNFLLAKTEQSFLID